MINNILKNMIIRVLFFGIFIVFVIVGCSQAEELDPITEREWQIESCEFIDSVASDFAVDYSIFTKRDHIFVAYYDKTHQLSLAMRNKNNWTYQKINEFVDWDEHKATKLFVDNDGYIHLFANMHCSPLTYYRSDEPYSINSFHKCSMVGSDEKYCTYPNFLWAQDKVIFHYRSGMSGNGVDIFNIYDTYSQKWSRFLDEPLFNGKGKCSSYFYGPISDSSGRYHIVWCWRSNGDCSTNWGVFYSYSDDLKTWNSLSGDSKSIPILPSDDIYLVDDVSEQGGLLNGCIVLGFDDNNKPIIIYHKYDDNGNTNVFCATPNTIKDKEWEIVKLTNWNWRWEFSGYGSIVYELYFHDVWGDNENVYCTYFRNQSTAKLLKHNKKTQEISISDYSEYPETLNEKWDLNMDIVHVIFDTSATKYDNQKYLIKYETINPNRGEKPERDCSPTRLMLYSIKR